jgi:hypothetical protein
LACRIGADFRTSGICGNVVRVAERQPVSAGGRNEINRFDRELRIC